MSTYTDASLIVTPNGKKAGKLYALKGADLDVVRATTATYVGSDGLIKTALANEVRFDYSNGSCPSILVEPQRTNLLLRSEEFDNASWVKLGGSSVTPNTTTAPDGNLTADTLSLTTNVSSSIAQSISLASATTIIFSVYVKVASGTKNFRLRTDNPTTTQSFTATTSWKRFSMTATPTGNTSVYVINDLAGTAGDLFIWGAQLEAGSNATSYIPTVASAVTRNADVISKSGITGITTITETFEDGTTNAITGSPTSYTMSQGRIKNAIGL